MGPKHAAVKKYQIEETRPEVLRVLKYIGMRICYSETIGRITRITINSDKPIFFSLIYRKNYLCIFIYTYIYINRDSIH